MAKREMMNPDRSGLMKSNTVPPVKYLTHEEARDANDLVDGRRVDKLQYIYDLKTQFRWEVGKTPKDLIRIWGITPAAMRKMAVDADNHFKMAIGDRETIRKAIFDRMEYITVSAMNNKKAMVVQDGRESSHIEYADQPDQKTALAGLVAMANITGTNIKKTEVTVTREDNTFEDLLVEMRNKISNQEPAALLTEGESTDD